MLDSTETVFALLNHLLFVNCTKSRHGRRQRPNHTRGGRSHGGALVVSRDLRTGSRCLYFIWFIFIYMHLSTCKVNTNKV